MTAKSRSVEPADDPLLAVCHLQPPIRGNPAAEPAKSHGIAAHAEIGHGERADADAPSCIQGLGATCVNVAMVDIRRGG
jgi:hypothetical protein